jgi:hypothetical protein
MSHLLCIISRLASMPEPPIQEIITVSNLGYRKKAGVDGLLSEPFLVGNTVEIKLSGKGGVLSARHLQTFIPHHVAK